MSTDCHYRRTFIREWRKFRNLTLERLADRVGMTPSHLSMLERGQRGYTQETLEMLADALMTHPASLLMCDPSDDEAIWSILEHATPTERRQIDPGPGGLSLPRGDGDIATSRLHREWLRAVTAATGLPPTTLAKKIGVSPSTLTRPLQEGDAGTSTLHAATIEKIVTFTGIAPPGSADVGRRRPFGFAEEASPFHTNDGGLRDAVAAMIAGRNGISPFALRTRALEAAGYLEGDIVLVDLDATPRSGDIVCAHIYDWHGGTAKTVYRVYDPPVLIAVPRDIALAPRPLIVDGDRVVIKGVVCAMIRPNTAGPHPNDFRPIG